MNLPIDLWHKRGDKLESMEMEFAIGEEHFHIEENKLEGFPPDVRFQRYTDTFYPSSEK